MDNDFPDIKFARVIQRDANAMKHINVIGHLDDHTLMDKHGQLLCLFKLNGINPHALSPQALDQAKQQRNHFFKQLDGRFALYHWSLHRPVALDWQAEFAQPFAQHLHGRYQEKLGQEQLFATEHYLGLIATPNFIGNASWLARLSAGLKAQAIGALWPLLQEKSQQLLHAFADYGIEILSAYEKGQRRYSAPFDFLGELLNNGAPPLPLGDYDLREALLRQRMFFQRRTGTIEWKGAVGNAQFAAALSIKAYSDQTFAGMLDGLQALRAPYALTQSFQFLDKPHSKAKLKRQQQNLLQAQDEATSQTESITASLDGAASGAVNYGLHHFVLMCFAPSQAALADHIAAVHRLCLENELLLVREDLGCELAFWSQLPGNLAYRPRAALLSTQNLAGLISLHNAPSGKKAQNHWGQAVTILETLSHGPYYFNFHDRDVGNTLIFGAMGSGKTVLQGFLLAQSLKFGGKRIVFDKDRGQEILVRALGGHYEILRPGLPTGFGPCQLPDTAENRQFLLALFKALLAPAQGDLPAAEVETIAQTIDRAYALPLADRQFRHIAPFFGIKTPNSLRARFDAWHSDGAYAWLFDQAVDALNLQPGIVGFELGALLQDKACAAPALMYLFHRAEQALANTRGAVFMDEGWQALDSPYFKAILNGLGRTPRKKDQFLCLATQSAADAATTDISKALIESATCKIFFPNPQAQRETYIEKLGLSEQDFLWITQGFPPEGHYFLLKHGQETAIARLPLTGLEDEIAALSGRSKTIKLLDQIRQEVGDDPEDWLPLFYQRRKEA